MSDLNESVFEDNSMSFDDQPLPSELEVQDSVPETTSEPLFELDGQQVPLSKLDPVKIKVWQDADKNRSKWQQENTRKAQEAADLRKKAETEMIQYQQQLNEYKVWNEFLEKNPDLQNSLREEIARRKQANPTVAPKMQTELEKKIEELNAWKIQTESQRRMEQAERRRIEVIEAMAAADPDFNKDDYMNFFEEATKDIDDPMKLHALLRDAMKGRSIQTIKKEAEKKVLSDIQNKRSALVEPGNKMSMNNLPNNKNPSSYDEAFAIAKSELGIK